MYYSLCNLKGKKLFEELLDRMEKKAFDDTYLELLAEYQSIYGETDRCDIFFAHYLLSKNLYQTALESALKAESKRPESRMVWELLIDCYQALGMGVKVLPYMGYCSWFYDAPLKKFSGTSIQMKEALRILSLAKGCGDYEPFLQNNVSIDNDSLFTAPGVLAGEHLLPFRRERGEYRYWVGIYQENGWLQPRGTLVELWKKDESFSMSRGAGTVTFDVIKSKLLEECRISSDSLPVILPVAGTINNQNANILSQSAEGTISLGKWLYSFLRVEKETHIQSDQPMAIGAPIYLKHNSKRKKIVLNLLLDGLCWRAVQDKNYELMPNTVDFFSKGIIFNQHFAASEYTYPSLVTIETGLYPYHHHILDDHFNTVLPERYVTMSEQMRALGYYCVNVMGSGYIYNGIMRGHDRIIIDPYELHTYAGVERIIRQMEAFDECDQFIFAHFMDTHPYFVGNFQIPLGAETKLDLDERVNGQHSVESTSVFLPCTKLYKEANRQGIRNTDRCLGALYSYLQTHYGEDEYIIQLYSDHGSTIYDRKARVLSDHQSSSAYMMRGAGIPQRGFVEELTSSADVYPSLGHLTGYSSDEIDGNLPSVLGGKERDYVISSSIYPGQTLKFCIRTKEYECYAESKDVVEIDGTVDFSGARISIHNRYGNEEAISDPIIQEKFLCILREHTKSINNEGHFWPLLRSKRPKWFGRLC